MVKKIEELEENSSMSNNNDILRSFGEWIRYIEGFTRGIGSAKTVEASQVLDCVGEVLEFMKVFKNNLISLLTYCEQILIKNEELEKENKELKKQLTKKLEDKNGKNM